MVSPTNFTSLLLSDIFDRVHEQLSSSVQGLSEEMLGTRPEAEANPIGWLAWHLTRVQDDHLAALAELPQAWMALGWNDRFALPYDASEHGYGHTSAQVSAFSATAADLIGYADDVHALSLEVLTDLTVDDFERVIDDAWDLPVTVAARVVSVVNEVNQHLGQIDYVRGLLERRLPTSRT